MKRPTKAMIKTIRRGKVCSSSFKISTGVSFPPSILHPPLSSLSSRHIWYFIRFALKYEHPGWLLVCTKDEYKKKDNPLLGIKQNQYGPPFLNAEVGHPLPGQVPLGFPLGLQFPLRRIFIGYLILRRLVPDFLIHGC